MPLLTNFSSLLDTIVASSFNKSPAATVQARPVRVEPAAPSLDPKTAILIGIAAILALHFGYEIFMPFALALLLTFVLAPLVRLLGRVGLPRVPAVVAVVLLAMLLLSGIGAVVTTQMMELASSLPRYEYNLRSKIQNLRALETGDGVFSRALDVFRHLERDLSEADRRKSAAPTGVQPRTPEADPIPVRVVGDAESRWAAIVSIVQPLLAPLLTAGMVLVFTIFMLIEREDLRDRLIRLAGTGDLSRTTAAMDDAATRVSRYLLMQLVINISYGVLISIGLWLIGIPNPPLWGLLCAVLRFIPYLGPFLGAALPILVSIAVDAGFTPLLLTIALFVGVELFSNNVMEPWLYGQSTGLSPLAILVAAVFWTTLWGPVGLILATPLTVCFVVLGRHVPHLQFLDVLLGSEPALPVEARIYQRLLARDPQEAIDLAIGQAEGRSSGELYAEVLLPVLSLAEEDRQRGVVEPEALRVIGTAVIDIVDEMADLDQSEPQSAEPPAAVDASALLTGGDGAQPAPVVMERGAADFVAPEQAARQAQTIRVIAARHELDTAGAVMLAHMLSRNGLAATVVPPGEISPRHLAGLQRDAVRVVHLCYIAPSTLHHAHRTARRLRRHFRSGTQIIVSVWNARRELMATGVQLQDVDGVATSLQESVDLVLARFPELKVEKGNGERTADLVLTTQSTR
ncbi:MAG TPA: AI-2E family transporter [Burkholderiales bacterium]|nr:AI-2E family transporter [Burkholderiales bacterium]